MKKYFVEHFVEFTKGDGRPATHFCYECDGIEFDQNWTGNCIRLVNANLFEKRFGQIEVRKEIHYDEGFIPIEKMMHWKYSLVVIRDNESQKIITSMEAK